ncbi:DUF4854 domain-containing protein [Demequina mangrovi]|uniref:Lipoprotein n=1 Tax=Demequina mangrovi TaxID=1043493 RepID=A0A1H7A3P0_9MICO|nr:hypothetical protein [Demequina mangrovi]SEJ58517.1 protein of unknown function [Demequina mangrovi]
MTIDLRRAAACLSATAALTFALAGCAADDPPQAAATETPPVAASSTPAPSANDAATSHVVDGIAEPAADQAAALAAYVAIGQEQIPTLMELAPGIYSEITIRGEGDNTLVFEYTYADQVDADVAAAGIDVMASTFQEMTASVIIPEMLTYGITADPQVAYTYLNADGSLIWSQAFGEE